MIITQTSLEEGKGERGSSVAAELQLPSYLTIGHAGWGLWQVKSPSSPGGEGGPCLLEGKAWITC